MVKILIAEKPSQGVALADAFGLTEVVRTVNIFKTETIDVKIFEGSYDGHDFIVIPSKGHLLRLGGRGANKNQPLYKQILFFNFTWKKPTKPTIKTKSKDKKDLYARYLLFEQEIPNADEIIVCTDADEEGELIGFNIVNHFNALGQTSRMIFQSLTERALRKSFDERIDIRMNIVDSGRFRSWGDRTFGYIFSKFLSKSYEIAVGGGGYTQLAVGRVMTPTLHIIIERMNAIEKVKKGQKNKQPRIRVSFNLNVILPDGSSASINVPDKQYDITMEEALKLKKKYNEVKGEVTEIFEEDDEDDPPSKGLTIDDIRSWSYSKGIEYVRCDSILEALYLSKLITYPRSESTILPSIEKGEVEDDYHSNIIDSCLTVLGLENFKDELVDPDLIDPRMGSEYDQAHWSIHPTEVVPQSKLPEDFAMIYEYVVKHYLKLFSFPEKLKHYKLKVQFDGIEEGYYSTIQHTYWTDVLEFGYKMIDNPTLLNYELDEEYDDLRPEIEVGKEIVCYPEISKTVVYPSVPNRLSKSDVFDYMRSENLGTDATRSVILEKLWKINLVRGDPPFLTVLGLRIDEAISQINPILIDPNLTRKFESIRQEIVDENDTLENSKDELKLEITDIIEGKLDDIEEIGENLAFFGECPKCNSRMKIISGKKGGSSFLFLACEEDDCTFTAPI